MLPAALISLVAVGACGGGGGSSGTTAGSSTVLIALDVPASTDAVVAGTITRGADLAVKEINAKGGVSAGGRQYQLSLRSYDDAGDPQRAASNTAAALADGAVAIIEDGTGATISAPKTLAAGVPEIATASGLTALGDGSLQSVFRLGIGNGAASSVLSAYVGSHKPGSAAVLHDDSADGRDGARQMAADLPTASVAVGPDLEAAASAPTLDAQLRQVADSHSPALVVWGGDDFVARALRAIGQSGLKLQVYSGPSGERPTVRSVAGAAAEGLWLVAARMTSESDSTSFPDFERRLAAAEGGPVDAGVKDAAGEEIRQPADTDFYSYDAVNLVVKALARAGSVSPGQGLLDAFTSVNVRSANGDSRGFRKDIHEGISDGDLYIARIHDSRFDPVKDEPLSATLPVEDQVLARFH